ncbi:hypothetical protein [Gallaecimonas sp. GXIMD4217]|uniref:general secretion pathway protein GspK n=1 Tax=Gallaecimonas sp. GXIMD4217 TaxID=3131927 RepID=UPI00311B0684
MPSAKPSRGIALVSVLWLLALLTLMAATLSVNSRVEGRLTYNLDRAIRGQALAEGAVRLAMLNLVQPQEQQPWLADGGFHELEMGGIAMRLALQDERGKIDINAATPELLTGLFLAAELDEDSLPLVDAILDWRDEDDLVRLHGAEDADYEAAGLDHGAKDAPFESLDELELVLGMTPKVIAAIRPALTVYSRRPFVHPLYAPRLVLLALPGTDEGMVDTYIETRRQHQQSGLPPPEFPLKGRLANPQGGLGLYYTIHTESFTGSDQPFRLSALIRRQGRQNDRPYRVMRFERGQWEQEAHPQRGQP